MNPRVKGAAFGLAAAALFGVSAPVSKLLLGSIPPVLLAGLLYLGAAIGFWLHRAFTPRTDEAPLTRRDMPRLVAMVASGGVVAPVLMLLGLARVSALSGSLLLNLEAPFTALLAVAVFKEHLGKAGAFAVIFIVAGAALIGFEPGELQADGLGVLLLAGACACWALDNNLTQRLSGKDPFALVRVKTTVAGLGNTVIGLVILDGAMPPLTTIGGALLLGSASYGLSVLLDAYALRLVGAAREAAYFATAPFVGALLALALFREPFGALDALAMVLMIIGVVFLLREKHAHEHSHDALEHEHLHEHDEHHQHAHEPGVDPTGPHSHAHAHQPMTHAHPHVSDQHHRHRH